MSINLESATNPPLVPCGNDVIILTNGLAPKSYVCCLPLITLGMLNTSQAINTCFTLVFRRRKL